MKDTFLYNVIENWHEIYYYVLYTLYITKVYKIITYICFPAADTECSPKPVKLLLGPASFLSI